MTDLNIPFSLKWFILYVLAHVMHILIFQFLVPVDIDVTIWIFILHSVQVFLTIFLNNCNKNVISSGSCTSICRSSRGQHCLLQLTKFNQSVAQIIKWVLKSSLMETRIFVIGVVIEGNIQKHLLRDRSSLVLWNVSKSWNLSGETVEEFFDEKLRYRLLSTLLTTGVILIDLYKAFDTIDRDTLLKKLRAICFLNLNIDWFKSYLSNRLLNLENYYLDL